MSADDSFLARIFSFKLSPSRRAAAIRSWMSPWFWDMAVDIEGCQVNQTRCKLVEIAVVDRIHKWFISQDRTAKKFYSHYKLKKRIERTWFRRRLRGNDGLFKSQLCWQKFYEALRSLQMKIWGWKGYNAEEKGEGDGWGLAELTTQRKADGKVGSFWRSLVLNIYLLATSLENFSPDASHMSSRLQYCLKILWDY